MQRLYKYLGKLLELISILVILINSIIIRKKVILLAKLGFKFLSSLLFSKLKKKDFSYIY